VLDGLTIVVVSVYGALPGWFDAKEMWSTGCQSFVAILVTNGRSRSLLTVGMISRPLVTAKEPFCCYQRSNICELARKYAYWWAEIFLQIDNDQCGFEIVSRHSFIGVAISEVGK
jgi:hypothetical protein